MQRVERGKTTNAPSLLRRLANSLALRDPLARLSDLQRSDVGAARIDVVRCPIAYVSRPETVRAVLDSRIAGVAERGRFFEEISRVIGPSSLVTCDGEEHRRLRRLLGPAFAPDRVATYASTMVEATEAIERRWTDNMRVVLGEELSCLTLDIASRALLGLDETAELDAFVTILQAGTKVLYRLLLPRHIADRLWRTRLSPANRRLFAAQSRVDAFVTSLLEARRNQTPPASPGGKRSGRTKPVNLLDVLLATDDGGDSPLTQREIRDQVVTFLFAGHETTAQALTWAFVQIALHPAVEDDLVAELRQVLGSRAPTSADLPRLELTRAVVRETLRLFPPAWFSSREANVATTVDGCGIAPGTLLVTSAMALHRDGRHWPDPDRFDPSRWLGPTRPSGAEAAYLPFGHGRHNCIGSVFATTELTLVLASIISRWRVRVQQPELVAPHATVTLRTRRPVVAIVETRT